MIQRKDSYVSEPNEEEEDFDDSHYSLSKNSKMHLPDEQIKKIREGFQQRYINCQEKLKAVMLKTKMMEQNLRELALYSKSGEFPLVHKAKTVLSASFKSEVENKESKLHRSGQAAIFQEEISNIAQPLTIGNKNSAKLDNKNFQEFKDIYDICARACLLRICQLPKAKENFSPLSAFMRKHHSHLEDPLLLTLYDQNTQLRQKQQQKDNDLSVQGYNEQDYHLDTELSLVTYFKEFLDSLISNSPNSHQVKQQQNQHNSESPSPDPQLVALHSYSAFRPKASGELFDVSGDNYQNQPLEDNFFTEIYSLLKLEALQFQIMMNQIKLQAHGFSLLKSGQLNSSMHLQEQGDTCEEVKLKEEVLHGILSFTIRCKIIVQAIKKVYGTQDDIEQIKKRGDNYISNISPELIHKQFLLRSLKYAYLALHIYISAKQGQVDKRLEPLILSFIEDYEGDGFNIEKLGKGQKKFISDIEKIIVSLQPKTESHFEQSMDKFNSSGFLQQKPEKEDHQLLRVRNIMLESKSSLAFVTNEIIKIANYQGIDAQSHSVKAFIKNQDGNKFLEELRKVGPQYQGKNDFHFKNLLLNDKASFKSIKELDSSIRSATNSNSNNDQILFIGDLRDKILQQLSHNFNQLEINNQKSEGTDIKQILDTEQFNIRNKLSVVNSKQMRRWTHQKQQVQGKDQIMRRSTFFKNHVRSADQNSKDPNNNRLEVNEEDEKEMASFSNYDIDIEAGEVQSNSQSQGIFQFMNQQIKQPSMSLFSKGSSLFKKAIPIKS